MNLSAGMQILVLVCAVALLVAGGVHAETSANITIDQPPAGSVIGQHVPAATPAADVSALLLDALADPIVLAVILLCFLTIAYTIYRIARYKTFRFR